MLPNLGKGFIYRGIKVLSKVIMVMVAKICRDPGEGNFRKLIPSLWNPAFHLVDRFLL